MLTELIRKTAALESGRRALQSVTGRKHATALESVLMKRAARADRDLLGIAAAARPDAVLRAYESLGGEYLSREEGR